MSFLDFLPSHVTPGVVAQSCRSSISCPVMAHMELLPSHVTPRTLAGEFLNSSGVMLSRSRLTPGAFAQSRHSWRFVQSCDTWNTCRRISDFQRRNAFATSCNSSISCPVMSLLELLPSRVTTGTAAGEFLISSGALLSPSRVTPGALAYASHTRSSCPVTSLLELSHSHVLLELLPSCVTP